MVELIFYTTSKGRTTVGMGAQTFSMLTNLGSDKAGRVLNPYHVLVPTSRAPPPLWRVSVRAFPTRRPMHAQCAGERMVLGHCGRGLYAERHCVVLELCERGRSANVGARIRMHTDEHVVEPLPAAHAGGYTQVATQERALTSQNMMLRRQVTEVYRCCKLCFPQCH